MALPEQWRERLRLPLIAAPMTLVSSPQLALAACGNGVIGSFPSHNATTIDELSGWLTSIAGELEQTQRHTEQTAAPLAVNLVVHRSNQRLEEDLQCLIAHRVELVIASVGSPAAIVEPLHDAGCLVFADVATLRHVDRALAAGVDGLVLLAAGAGGQTGWLNPLAFLRAVRARYDGPVVLAGGIADGASLWGAQVAGADLAYMGTKFIATTESDASDAYKHAVVSAGIDDIDLTTKLTGLRASVIAGPGHAARAGNGNRPAGFEHQRLLDHPHSSEADRAFSAGHSVTGVHDIVDAATVIHRTRDEYHDARRQTLALLSADGAAPTPRREAKAR
jgi:nitronate monooxygenase